MLGRKSLVGLDAKRDLEVMGLGEWYEQLGESIEISQSLKMDSMSCSYNSVSHRLDKYLNWR